MNKSTIVCCYSQWTSAVTEVAGLQVITVNFETVSKPNISRVLFYFDNAIKVTVLFRSGHIELVSQVCPNLLHLIPI